MQPLVSIIAEGIGQIWAAVLMAAVAARVAPPRKKRFDVQVDSRTLRDIGVEPGSIAWL